MSRGGTCALLAAAIAVAPLVTATAPSTAQAAQQSAAPSKQALDQIYTDAQIHVERYNSTGDAEQLRAAHKMLGEWLRGHAQLYGYSDQAVQARAPVQQQVAAIEDKLGDAAPAASTTPAPSQPPARTVSPEIAQRQRSANAMVTGGLVMGAVGLSSVLFVGLPALGLRNRAVDNSRTEEFRIEEEKYLDRARRRHTVMIVSMAIGGVFTIGGITLVSVGAAKKSAVNRELAFAPAVGPSFAGGSLRMRF